MKDDEIMMRASDPWMDKLSPSLEGELGADEQALLDAHLATCVACPPALAELRAIAQAARTLPEIPPPSDLWPGVEARIAAYARSAAALETEEAQAASAAPAPIPMPVRPEARARRGSAVRGLTLSWPQLVAAGLLLAALSGGGVWFATRGVRGQAAGPAGGLQGATIQPASAEGDPTYAAEVADLERTLDARRGQLDPTTVRTIESNLHIIDLATAQARQALAADPSNPYLKAYLSRTMRQKVDVLKQATVFASTR
jgi:anti-sigma factor RsiW